MSKSVWPQIGPPMGIPWQRNDASHQARGLAAWWPMLTQVGGIIRNFGRPYSLNLTLQDNAAFGAAEAMGRVLKLDGTNDYASNATASLGFTGDAAWSITLWLNPSALTNDSMWVSYGTTSHGNTICIGTAGGNFKTTAYGFDTTFGVAPTLNVWQHVGLTYDPSVSTAYLYVNGVQKATWSVPDNYVIQATGPMYIGSATWGTRVGACQIGDVRIYSRTLSAGEVAAMFLPQTRWDLYAPLWTPAYYAPPPPPAPPPHAANNAVGSLYREPRSLTPHYEIYLTDIYTRRLALVRRFESLTYSKSLNSVGEFELTLPSSFDISLVREGGLIEIHRAHDRQDAPRIEFVGFILSQPKYFTSGGGRFIKVSGMDTNHMLTWREQVGYTSTSELLNEVDDNMRYFVDVNLGLGSAVGRSLTPAYGATVEPDRSTAKVMYMQVSRRPLLDYLEDLARQSSENSYKRVKLFYGMVVTQVNPLKVQFQVRPDRWGMDRTMNSSRPVVLRAERGLRNVVLDNDASEEKTAIYVEYNSGTIATPVTNDTRLNTWPGGRREGYINVNDTGDATIAADAARVELRASRRVYRARGEIEQRRGLAYGDYNLGDHVTLAADGVFSTVRVDSVSVTVAGGAESLNVRYEYVD